VQGVFDGIPIVLVLLAGVGAPLAGWYATRCARNPAIWFVLGAFTGPIALALLVFAPPGRCPMCDAPVEGWASSCDRCGASLRFGSIGEPGPAPREDRPDVAPAAAPARAPVAFRTLGSRISSVEFDRPASASASSSAPSSASVAPTPIGSARASNRRDARSGWPSRPMASPMSLGIRPTFTASNYVTATTSDEINAGEVLSTGVYISGNAGLEIGACYAIAREGDQLRVFGPVDAGQLTVRHEGAVLDFDVTAMDDRVIISGREGRSSLAIVFRTIGGMRAADLELALAAPVAGAGS
jgi:hypothetical protein